MITRSPSPARSCSSPAPLSSSHPRTAQLQIVGDGGPGPVKAQHLTAELVSLSPAIAPGGTLQAGLVLTLEEHWHVYWLNAGDSGEPPKITWTLPEGITAGPMQFPNPQPPSPRPRSWTSATKTKSPSPSTSPPPASLKPGPIHLDAKVTWLVCREVCIPGKAHLGLNLNVDPRTPPLPRSPSAPSAKPSPSSPSRSHPTSSSPSPAAKPTSSSPSPPASRETNAEFYPFDQEQIANAAPQPIEPPSDGVRLRVRRADDLKTLPAQLHGIIKLSDKSPTTSPPPSSPANSPAAPGSSRR